MSAASSRAAGRRTCTSASSLSRSMASFSVRFLGCKVSQTDAQALRERLVRDGHREVEGGGDVAVVNTCCVTNEGLAKSRRAAARRARGRVYVTGCGAALGDRLRRLPRTSPSCPARSSRRSRRSPATSARSLRPGGRAARPRARVREDPGRLLVLVRVLRDPARARRHPQPQRRRRPRRDPPPRRAGHREIVLTGVNLGCFRDRAAG